MLDTPAQEAPIRSTKTEQSGSWTFLSNHTHVLVCLSRDPGIRLRDIAHQVGITERATQRIVSELEDSGVLTRTRDGRRNRYQLHTGIHLRHPLQSHCTIGELLRLFNSKY